MARVALTDEAGHLTGNPADGVQKGRGILEERTARTDAALARVGYKIGTGGRGVVMLRFDDYPDTFLSKVVPVLRKYDLPCYWAATVNHVENLSSVTWAQLNEVAVKDGVQMTGHSWSHGQATTPEGIVHEVLESADYFEAQMPATRIDVWTQPSVGGPTPYGDYDGNDDAEFYNTQAGRLIMSRYAVVNGARPGFYHPQGHTVPLGTSNLTYESFAFADFKTYVDEIAAGGYAADLMLHPGRLDTTGYMTSATFDECMGYVAQLRDEGRLMALTGLAKAVLDGGSDYRHNLLPGDFSSGVGGWYANGYTLSNGVLTAPGYAQAMIEAVPIARFTGAAGSVREFHAVVRSAAANTLRVTIEGTAGTFSVTKDYTIPGDGQWHDIRRFFMVPYTGETYVQFTIVSPGGVPYDVHQVNAYAA